MKIITGKRIKIRGELFLIIILNQSSVIPVLNGPELLFPQMIKYIRKGNIDEKDKIVSVKVRVGIIFFKRIKASVQKIRAVTITENYSNCCIR